MQKVGRRAMEGAGGRRGVRLAYRGWSAEVLGRRRLRPPVPPAVWSSTRWPRSRFRRSLPGRSWGCGCPSYWFRRQCCRCPDSRVYCDDSIAWPGTFSISFQSDATGFECNHLILRAMATAKVTSARPEATPPRITSMASSPAAAPPPLLPNPPLASSDTFLRSSGSRC